MIIIRMVQFCTAIYIQDDFSNLFVLLMSFDNQIGFQLNTNVDIKWEERW